MNGLKPTYRIRFDDWLDGQDISGKDKWSLGRDMVHLLFDVRCNDVYKIIDLDWCDEPEFDEEDENIKEFKDGIPFVLKFFKELEAEGIKEVLVDVSW